MTRNVSAPEAEIPAALDRSGAAPVGGLTLESFAGAPRVNAWIYERLGGVSGDVLEIGSGIGNLSRFIVRDARTAFLTDVEPEYVGALRREFGSLGDRVRVETWNLDTPPPPTLAGQLFDTIVAVNVIEHIRNDVEAVQRLSALLRPGGTLLIYVPAGPLVFGSLDVALGHYRRYSRSSLARLIQQSGLEMTPPRYMNRLGLVGWFFSGRVLKRRVLSAVMVTLFEQVVGIARVIDAIFAPLPLGLGLVARARKP